MERMRSRRWAGIAALSLVVAVVGVSLALRDSRGPDTLVGPARETSTTTSASQTVETRAKQAAAPNRQLVARRQMPIPVRIVIPAIGVDARVVKLGLNSDDTMQVPSNLADTGWFQQGPEPGEVGAAVIVGHLNSGRGPGVFARLAELKAGNVITVYLRDGSRVRFVARSMMRVAKSRFPTNLVYARTAKPSLRLITCAGRLNRATGHHYDNYIVFASLLGARV
jgi:sortase (surface protein transpeptidase)